MRRFLALCLSVLLVIAFACPAFAAEGSVIYSENAERFFFEPGTRYSPTDLFPNFKDVMPGDSLEQRIEVKNPKRNDCKIKIYMRARGTHPGSEEFLSQMNLTVETARDEVLFDAPANKRAQLQDWVYLGTLYSGGESELIVTLDVPVSMDNRFQHDIGYLDWEFAVMELPVEPADPKPPITGDDFPIFLVAVVMAVSLAAVICLVTFGRKKKERK